MSKYCVLVTRRLPSSALASLKERCHVDLWNSDDVIPRKVLLDRVRGKDGLLCLLTDAVDGEVLNTAGSNLRVVSTMSVGVDHIDLQECRNKGLLLGYTPNILTSATAELTVALLLATMRRIVESAQAVRNGSWGTWKPMWMCGLTLDGSTVGMLGLGRIGLAVVERLRPFGVRRFLFHSASIKSEEFQKRVGASWVTYDELLRESDVMIVCCALNRETSGILDKSSFEKMKSTAVLINIARGGVVEQGHLVDALRTQQIRAAGLDVTTPEPLPTDHPLLKLDNCVVTPHIGSATEATRIKMAELAVANLLAGLGGAPMPAPFQFN